MRESSFGFQYTWADLEPVRPLAVTLSLVQVAGATVGLVFPLLPGWFESAWFGACVPMFPAFLVGLVVQSLRRPGSIAENGTMVRRLGLLALFLSSVALSMPMLGFGNEG